MSKVFDTTLAERLCDSPPAVSSYWKPMLRALIAGSWGQTIEKVAA